MERMRHEHADLLVLDDLGAEKPSEWVEETMNLIVNTRYNEKRPTIFTTNYIDIPDETDLDSLKVRVGFRMHSRLHEMCDFLEYDGGDFRMLPPNGGAQDLMDLWQMSKGRRALPSRTRGPMVTVSTSPMRTIWLGLLILVRLRRTRPSPTRPAASVRDLTARTYHSHRSTR